MKLSLHRRSVVTESPALLHVEPESDVDAKTLEAILEDFPESVIGFGRNASSWKIAHMQLRIEHETDQPASSNDVGLSGSMQALADALACGEPKKVCLYDEEGVDGWQWTHPDGREWTKIGSWDEPAGLHPLAEAVFGDGAVVSPHANAMRSGRRMTLANSPQWTLGDLIEALEKLEVTDDCWVSYSLGNFLPTNCRSWRGAYEELSIGYEELKWDCPRRLLKDFVEHLKDCVGETFAGWKGGDFVMHSGTPLWVAEPGESGNCGVIGIHPVLNHEGKAYRVHIRTDICEY